MTARAQTTGFGASPNPDSHIFYVQIPESRQDPVFIAERFGRRHTDRYAKQEEPRVILERRVWSGIAETARRVFNARLKSEKVRTGRWSVGINHVDRVLGKELCVLAWAAETATREEIRVITNKWAALRREERWWLYAMTVAEAGTPEDTKRGWRRALYHALSDGEPPRHPQKKSKTQVKESQPDQKTLSLPLFEE